MKIKLIIILVALLIFSPIISKADTILETFNFFRITNNSQYDVGNQLYVEVWEMGAQVMFKFGNNVGISSSITDIYFDDGNLLSIYSISYSTGVKFSSPATPNELPGGNSITPSFETNFSADSDSPVPDNGVNASTEWVAITFNLINGGTPAGTLAALRDGSLRIGLHIQALPDGQSDSYINKVPEPGILILLGIGMMGVGIASRYLRKI